MIDSEHTHQQLSSIRSRLESSASRPEGETADLETELLYARALDLVSEVLTGRRVAERIKTVEEKSNYKEIIALIDLASDAITKRGLVQVADPEMEPYLAALISNAFWRVRIVRTGVMAIGIGFALVLALFTAGTMTVFDRVWVASDTVGKAEAKLVEAGEKLTRAAENDRAMQNRIERFRNETRDREAELDQIDDQIDVLDEKLDNSIIDATEDIEGTISSKLISFRANISKFEEELKGTISVRKDSLVDRLEGFDVQISEIEESLTNAKANIGSTAANEIDKAISSLSTILESEETRLKLLAEGHVTALNELASELTGKLRGLRQASVKLEEEAFDAGERFGSIRTQTVAIERIREELTTAETTLIQLNDDIAPAVALIGNLNANIDPVVNRIQEAMKLSSNEIAQSFVRVLDSDRWLKILAVACAFLFILSFFLIWRLALRVRESSAVTN